MKINVKRLKENATLPTRGSKHAAGYDLYACLDKELTIPTQETVKVPTGLAFEIPEGHFAAIYARSGLATKQGLRPANAVGVCDSDYRGEYIVALHNDSTQPQTIQPSERIAQLIIQAYQSVDEFVEVDELESTERGSGGFGSTGKH